jgi:hypothetical protein
MRLSEAKNLKHGDTIYHRTAKNTDGTQTRARITGAVKTWKTDPDRIRVPWKHGLYTYGAIESALDLEDWNINETTAK